MEDLREREGRRREEVQIISSFVSLGHFIVIFSQFSLALYRY